MERIESLQRTLPNVSKSTCPWLVLTVWLTVSHVWIVTFKPDTPPEVLEDFGILSNRTTGTTVSPSIMDGMLRLVKKFKKVEDGGHKAWFLLSASS
jgi:hypothetical protein